MKKKISISIPVFNEERNIKIIVNKIKKFFENKKYNYEIIFSDNYSKDRTVEIIKKLSLINKNIKLISFIKNYGYDISLLENYKYSTGDAIISIDADMQDPINIFNKFIKKWEVGYDLVYGIRTKRIEPALLTIFRKLFYLILRYFSEYKLPLNSGDFRLIDKKIINQLRNKNFKHPYTRAITFNLAKKTHGIKYSRSLRRYEKSKFGVINLFKYSTKVIFFETNLIEYLLIIKGILILLIGHYKIYNLLIFYIILIIFYFVSKKIKTTLKEKKFKVLIKKKINI